MTKDTRSLSLLIVFLLPLLIHAQQFAVYTMSYGTTNMINVFSGNATGFLTFSNSVSTGGSGPTTSGVQNEHGLFVAGNYLFAVNPSSNTLSVLSISATNPTQLTLLGTPANTGGEFPVSVTAYNGIACVVNSGQSNGFQCFTYGSSGLTLKPNSYQNLSLSLTTPPASHTGPAQISFNPSGTALVITNKLAGMTAPPLYVAPLTAGVAANGVFAAPVATNTVSFGFAFVGSTNAFVLTDPTQGVAAVSVTLAAVPSFSISTFFSNPDESGACWVSQAPLSGNFYVGNAGTAAMTEMILTAGTVFTVGDNYPLPGGATENAVATIGGVDYVFQISSAVSATSTLQQINVFRLSALGAIGIQSIATQNSASGGSVAVYVATAASSSSSSTGQSGSAPTAVSCSLPFVFFVTIVSLLSLLF